MTTKIQQGSNKEAKYRKCSWILFNASTSKNGPSKSVIFHTLVDDTSPYNQGTENCRPLDFKGYVRSTLSGYEVNCEYVKATNLLILLGLDHEEIRYFLRVHEMSHLKAWDEEIRFDKRLLKDPCNLSFLQMLVEDDKIDGEYLFGHRDFSALDTSDSDTLESSDDESVEGDYESSIYSSGDSSNTEDHVYPDQDHLLNNITFDDSVFQFN